MGRWELHMTVWWILILTRLQTDFQLLNPDRAVSNLFLRPQSKVWRKKSLRVCLDWSVPAAFLNNPVLFAHSGVGGSASSLSPEAVDIKREEEPWMVIWLFQTSQDKFKKWLVAWATQDMLPGSYPLIWWSKDSKRTNKTIFSPQHELLFLQTHSKFVHIQNIFHHLHL